MAKIYHSVVKFLEYGVGVLFLALATITFIQVFCRYILKNPLTWAHEVDIILMVWAVWLSAAIGIHRKAHLRITLFRERFSKKVQGTLTILFDFFILIFLMIVVIKGIDVIQSMEGMTFTSVDVPRGLMFAAAPIGAALMIMLFLPVLRQDIDVFTRLRRKG